MCVHCCLHSTDCLFSVSGPRLLLVNNEYTIVTVCSVVGWGGAVSMCHVARVMYLASVDRLVSSSLATRWLLQVFLDPSFGYVSHLIRTWRMGDGMNRNSDPIFLPSPLFPWSLVSWGQ